MRCTGPSAGIVASALSPSNKTPRQYFLRADILCGLCPQSVNLPAPAVGLCDFSSGPPVKWARENGIERLFVRLWVQFERSTKGSRRAERAPFVGGGDTCGSVMKR